MVSADWYHSWRILEGAVVEADEEVVVVGVEVDMVVPSVVSVAEVVAVVVSDGLVSPPSLYEPSAFSSALS